MELSEDDLALVFKHVDARLPFMHVDGRTVIQISKETLAAMLADARRQGERDGVLYG